MTIIWPVMRRFLIGVLVLLAVSFLAYMLIGLMPGDPVDLMAAGNPHMTAADLVRLREFYGLDKPLTHRYAAWLQQVLSGDFGYSRLYTRPVLEAIAPALVTSMILMISSLCLTLLCAIPLGVLAARFQGGRFDYGINLFCFAGVSLPSFWLAILLIYIFAVIFGLLPAGGMAHGSADFFERASHFVLPIFALTLSSIGGYIRHIRAAIIQVQNADFIRTARAIGATEDRIYHSYIPRHITPPLMTIFMLDLGTLFSGALITETVFGLHGMGKLLYDAMMGNDFNLALVILLVLTILIYCANQMADMAVYLSDPRAKNKNKTQGRV